MNESTYRGDSPGKKVSRAKLWTQTAQWMTSLNQPYLGSLVLAGHGGDISVIKGMGMNPARVTAVDICQDAADYCKELHPEANVIKADAAQISKNILYNTAHLDFCNSISIDNMKTIVEVMRNIRKPGIVAITMLKGREVGKQDFRQLVPKITSAQRRFARKTAASRGFYIQSHLMLSKRYKCELSHLMEMAEKEMRSFMGGLQGWAEFNKHQPKNCRMFKRTGSLTALGFAFKRLVLIRSILEAAMYGEEIHGYPVFCTTYQSKTKHSQGTPFYTVAFMVSDNPRDDHLIQSKLHECAAHHGHYFRSLMSGEEQLALKIAAAELSKLYSAGQVAQMLDVKKGRIAAWKAHDTMGTYGVDDYYERSKISGIAIQTLDNIGGEITPGRVLPIERGTIHQIERMCDNLGFGKDEPIEVVFTSSQSPVTKLGWGDIVNLLAELRRAGESNGS